MQPNDLTESEIAEAMEICARATEGPWEGGQLCPEECEGDYCIWAAGEHGREYIANVGAVIEAVLPKGSEPLAFDMERNDAAFIAAARTALPRALAELQRRRAEPDLWALYYHFVHLLVRQDMDYDASPLWRCHICKQAERFQYFQHWDDRCPFHAAQREIRESLAISSDTRNLLGEQVEKMIAGMQNDPLRRRAEPDLRGLVGRMRDGLEKLRRKHFDCDDCFYSCPKSEDGCCNVGAGSECNCGADEENAVIEALIAESDAALNPPAGEASHE